MKQFDNVLPLVADALRADAVLDQKKDDAPFISKLASENAVFKNCYSTSSHTREAVPSMLTGLYPSECVDEKFSLNQKLITSDLDVKTGGFHSNPYVSKKYGYEDDFEIFYDHLESGFSGKPGEIFGSIGELPIVRSLLDSAFREDLPSTFVNRAVQILTNTHYARGEKINSKIEEFIDNEDFFAWIQYMDTHGPYDPPEPYRSKKLDGERITSRKAQKIYRKALRNPDKISETEEKTLKDLYRGEISYTDENIRKLFNLLGKRNIKDDTLVIITADHGEGFGEDGFYEHPRKLTEKLLHVPLILIHPSIDSQEIERPVSLIDIAPTLMKALGEQKSLKGENLLETLSSENIERTVFAQVRKHRSTERVFASISRNFLDKAEADSESGEILKDPETDQLRSHLMKHIESYKGSEEDKKEEIKEQLEALGYTGEKQK